ncbi:hypothetical protein [Microbacterium gubbeenense]|uniref:hypothetical protein n=1 Tax=Microbacterium gubbeenense TaxID=159896 RepID=UPI003F97C0CC
MTTSGDTATLREPTQNVRIAPHTILLNVVAVISWIAIISVMVWQRALDPTDVWDPPADDASLVGELEAWVDVLFIVAISATVGLIVLGAVRHMLNQLTPAPK